MEKEIEKMKTEAVQNEVDTVLSRKSNRDMVEENSQAEKAENKLQTEFTKIIEAMEGNITKFETEIIALEMLKLAMENR